MNILICNDDGINSEGIISLAKSLSREHNVMVAAPTANCSGYAHSLSINKQIKVKRADIDGIEAYAVDGTPCDCVKFALHNLRHFKPDLVCSGVNVGHNLGSDVVYSGTVSAGFEANYYKLPSIAFSSTGYSGNDMAMCGEIARKIIGAYFDKLSPKITLNVNIPNVDRAMIKGVKVTKLGRQIYCDQYIGRGEDSYSLEGYPINHEENDSDCDVEWNKQNYITVTPLLYDKTDYSTIGSFSDNIDIK